MMDHAELRERFEAVEDSWFAEPITKFLVGEKSPSRAGRPLTEKEKAQRKIAAAASAKKRRKGSGAASKTTASRMSGLGGSFQGSGGRSGGAHFAAASYTPQSFSQVAPRQGQVRARSVDHPKYLSESGGMNPRDRAPVFHDNRVTPTNAGVGGRNVIYDETGQRSTRGEPDQFNYGIGQQGSSQTLRNTFN